MRLSKVISSEIDSLKRRVVKVLGRGKSDVQTGYEASPFGIDSKPVKDLIAVFADTEGKGETVIIGYLLKNQLSKVNPGETRLYSTDASGVEKFEVYLKNDGTAEIGGDSDNMVRYSKLKEAFDELKSDFNSLVSTFNSHTHGGVLSGPAATAAPASPGQSSSADISPAKIDEIKTL